jgi:internalin A
MSSQDLAVARERIAAELVSQTGQLDLSGLKISELPPELKELSFLKSLDFSGDYLRGSLCQVSDLEPLRGLTGLQNLDCSGTEVRDLEPLRDLTSLRTLFCRFTEVSDLEPLRDLTSLQNLDCGETKVSGLEPLRDLTSLQNLNCLGTKVSNLEPLRDLKNLRHLDCTATKVSDFEPLRCLNSLKSLDCRFTEVSDLGPLRDLKNLQHLDCSATKVSDFEPLRSLNSLQTLQCWQMGVRDLEPLRGLTNLQQLNCGNTQVCSLDPLRDLSSLIDLACWSTQVSDLEPLQDLSSLQKLNFVATEVSDLEPLRKLANLQELQLDGLQISDLEPLRELVNLQVLHLGSINVRNLAPLVALQTLREIWCTGLKLSDFPRKLLFSECLQRLNLEGCSILGVPKEAYTQDSSDDRPSYFHNCLDTLRAHVLDLEVKAVPIKREKILVLGNGGVGKTQLCRHLAGEPFDSSVPSTHGITVRTLTAESDGESTYVIWDFGGQDIYHSAHTLFMRTAAVFVVLWTPEQEALVPNDENDPLHRRHPLNYWLDYVRTLGRPDSPVLVVQSQCDTAAQAMAMPPVNKRLLEGFGCLRSLSFSARTGRGVANLRESLADASAYLRDRDGISTIGKGRYRVWQQLEAWRQADEQLAAPQRQQRTLSQQQFASLCEQTSDVSSPEALLRFLHNKGVVFHSPKLFYDRIILDQSWALEAVYAVFERGSTYPLIIGNDGRLTPSLLANTVWRNYEPEARELFLSLMCTCGILFPYRKADAALSLEAVYLAPDLLPPRFSPQVERELQGRWQGSDPSLSLIYSYDFLHDGLARALLCDLGNHAGDSGVYWRYGAWVYDARHDCIALLEQEKTDDRDGRITIHFLGERCGDLIDWFKERQDQHNRQFGYADLQPTCTGPLASELQPVDKWQRLEASAGDESAVVPPPQLVPAPVESFHKPGREVFISYAWGDRTPAGQERQQIVDGIVNALREHSETITVRIDRDELRPGGLISAFMDRLAAADRIIVVISAKYLQSEYCMYELFKIYQNCRKSGEHFHRHIIPVVLPDAGFSGGLAARLKTALYWIQQEQELTTLVAGNPQAVGTTMFTKYRLIGEFARNSSDMIEYLIDQLQPRDYCRQIAEGFVELREQILAT